MLSDRASDHVHGGRDSGTDFVDGFPCWLRQVFRSRLARTEFCCFDQSIRLRHRHRCRAHRLNRETPFQVPHCRCREYPIVSHDHAVVLVAVRVQAGQLRAQRV